MTLARRALKVKVMYQANVVGPTYIEGRCSSYLCLCLPFNFSSFFFCVSLTFPELTVLSRREVVRGDQTSVIVCAYGVFLCYSVLVFRMHLSLQH